MIKSFWHGPWILGAALCWLSLFPGSARAQFTLATNSGSITITGYTGTNGTVIIPSATNGYPVSSIASFAFFNRTNLTSLTLGTNVACIGQAAFYGCRNLLSVTFPKSLGNIGDNSFEYCSSLTNIVIGGSTTNIGNAAFTECAFARVVIPDSVISLQGFAFYGCSNLTDVTIGAQVTSIGQAAFYSCSSLSRVTIPDSVTNIGGSAFQYCNHLTNVLLGNRVSFIGNSAFGFCGFASITLPKSISTIQDAAFIYCTNLASIFFEGDLTTNISSTLFANDNNPNLYYLPGSSGWGSSFGGVPAVLWNPQVRASDAGFGVRMNRFGFNITGTVNIPIVVEASTNPGGTWVPLQSARLTNGAFYLSDPQWTNYRIRYYRIRSP